MFYEMGYIICALLVLFMIGYRFFRSKRVNSIKNFVFSMLIICGIVDVGADVISTAMIANSANIPVWAGMLATQIFYLMQTILPFLMFLFCFVLAGDPKKYRKIIVICMIPVIIALAAWILNPFTHILFYFDAAKVYHRPALNVITYLSAGFYLISSCVAAVSLKKEMGVRCMHVMVLDSVLCIVCALLQYLNPDILLTGVAITCAITMMYLYLQNSDVVIDGLTGCFDRTALNQYLAGGLTAEKGYGIVLSLTGFRSINTVFGSNTGDKLLQQIGYYLQKICQNKPNCEVYRVMGDIFLVTCRKENTYQELWEDLREHAQRQYYVEGQKIWVSACFVRIEQIDLTPTMKDEIVPVIEYALGKAKASPTPDGVVLDETILEEYKHIQQLEKYLYDAVEQNLFFMTYQPIWSVEEHRFVMLEALARLRHPDYGIVMPDEFIPIAERNGMIPKVTRCVLEMVGKFICEHDLESLGINSVKVNLSAVDLMNADLKNNIEQVLNKNGMKPGMLSFEITETVATCLNQEVRDILSWMEEKMLSLSIDDFGTGYANLKMVMDLSFDIVKLDRSMLLAAQETQQGRDIYRSLVQMFKGLGFMIVAEGAETKEEVEMLENWGIDCIQGFYYARPLTEDKVCELLIDKCAEQDREEETEIR